MFVIILMSSYLLDLFRATHSFTLSLVMMLTLECTIGIPIRVFVIWYTLHVASWSFYAVGELSNLFFLQAVCLVSMYYVRLYRAQNEPTGNYLANCRFDELILTSFVPIVVSLFAIANIVKTQQR